MAPMVRQMDGLIKMVSRSVDVKKAPSFENPKNTS
jgi:hypothetical protein